MRAIAEWHEGIVPIGVRGSNTLIRASPHKTAATASRSRRIDRNCYARLTGNHFVACNRSPSRLLAHEAGTGAKGSHWCAGERNGMVTGTATRLESLSAIQARPTGVER
jgi:hypothetical protein